jgi:hypothetical protein
MNRTNLDFFIMFFILQKCFPEKKEKIPAPVILIARAKSLDVCLLTCTCWLTCSGLIWGSYRVSVGMVLNELGIRKHYLHGTVSKWVARGTDTVPNR